MKAITFAGVVASALLLSGAAEPQSVLIEVEAGPRERDGVPVVFSLPDAWRDAGTLGLIEDLDNPKAIAAQVLPGSPARVAFILDDLPANAHRRYRLRRIDMENPARPASCVDDGKGLALRVGDRPVLRYNSELVEPPSGIESIYRRSGFIHPLQTPSGRVVTADFAEDHPHQHGLFFAWVNATFRGHRVDFWNQKEGLGRIRHVEVLGKANGPVFAQFSARLRHEDVSGPGDPVPVLDEVWTVRAYNVADHFLVDFESRQTCAGEHPLEINKYHYGGLGLRGNSLWFDPEVKGENPPSPDRSGRSDFLTSQGKGRAEGNHTRPRWVDLSGRIDGRFAGVSILDHPSNFRSPQPVRLHPNKPYFCFAPMVLGGFAIEPGREYVSRYRLVLHDGPPDAEAIDRLWSDYADPPRVNLVDDK